MRGRKKKTNAYNSSICIKLTKEQKDIWDKNEWIADEIRESVRRQLDVYTMKNNKV